MSPPSSKVSTTRPTGASSLGEDRFAAIRDRINTPRDEDETPPRRGLSRGGGATSRDDPIGGLHCGHEPRLRLLAELLPTLLSAMNSLCDLVIENLALHQQLATLAGRRHPDIRLSDRVSWVLLCRSWSRGAEALAIVRPPPCRARSEHSSGGWPPRTPGARPASTESCCASASTSPSAAFPGTSVPCPGLEGLLLADQHPGTGKGSASDHVEPPWPGFHPRRP